MRCPYCRTPLSELSPECPECRLNLQRAAAILGPVPRLEPGVSDSTDAFHPGEIRAILHRIKLLKQRFPQVQFHAVCRAFPTEHPIELYAFWLLNLGGFFGEHEKAGSNHSVLLLIDPLAGRSTMMLGYGLEPFIDEQALEQLLEMAEPAWIDREWAEGILNVIEGPVIRPPPPPPADDPFVCPSVID